MNKFTIIVQLSSILFNNQMLAQVSHSNAEPSHSSHEKSVKFQVGTASFYADKFNGRSSANGEIFSQKKMTAASNTLPLNIWVKVTNLRNCKTVIVKITDRMYHNNKRLIDLSRAAAVQLGYTGRGLTRVKVEVLGKKRPRASKGNAYASSGWIW
jgi:rare lipoprotein A